MKIIVNQDDLEEVFESIYPFNLKRSLKFVEKNTNLTNLLKEFDAIIERNQIQVIYKKNDSKIIACKVRVADKDNRRGKSSGYRVIALIDYHQELTFVFDIYSKIGSGRKGDISAEEKEKLISIFDAYVEN